MNAIKSLAIITVLAVAGAGLYVSFNTPPPEPPPGFTDNLDYVGDEIAAPQIEIPGETASDSPVTGMPPVGASAPPPLSDAPPLASSPAGAPAANPSSMMNAPPPLVRSAPADSSAPPPAFGATSTAMTPPPLAAPGAAVSAVSPPLGGTTTTTPTKSGTFADARQAAQELLDRSQLAAAHLLLSPWYGDASLTPTEAVELRELLSQLAGTVIYSRQHLLEPAHRVQTGETLESIATTYQVPWQLLAKINGLAMPAHVTVGQELKVVRGPFSAVVSTERRELVLTVAGRYAGRFTVAVGRDVQVIDGQWTVKQKQTNPVYNGPSGTIAADDPTNPLGEHFIRLASAVAPTASTAIGIHGTHDPASLQTDDPRGFVRLAPRDAEDVHDILTVGSKVTIRR